LGPPPSRERLELKTSNLACRFITRGTNKRNAKLGQKGSGRGQVTYFRKYGTPSISRERLELETSNLACRFITRGTNEISAKLGQRGSGSGHVTLKCKIGSKRVRKGSRDLILKFSDPSISRERLELETSNLACRFITRGTNEINAKLRQKGSRRGHVT